MMNADVMASDLTPEMFDAGRRQAADRGVELEWQEGDAEALPFGGRRVRRGDVLPRRDVCAAPPGRCG